MIARGFSSRKIRRRKAKNAVIFLWKIRKTEFFGGRSMIAPTSSKENRVSRQSAAGAESALLYEFHTPSVSQRPVESAQWLYLTTGLPERIGSGPCPAFIKNSVYFLCKVCYTIISVRRDGQTRAERNRKTQTFLRAVRPSTRRYRVKGDGAGRLEFMHFLCEMSYFERSL